MNKGRESDPPPGREAAEAAPESTDMVVQFYFMYCFPGGFRHGITNETAFHYWNKTNPAAALRPGLSIFPSRASGNP